MKTKLRSIYFGLLFLAASIGFSQPTWQSAICLVTVDYSTASYIQVLWDKPVELDIDSFYIYRADSSAGNFTKIAAVSYTDSSYYNDIAVNVNTQWYKYEISAKDFTGIEGPLSNPANNCCLNVIPNVASGYYTCAWNVYQNFSNFPSTMRCMWDSLGSGSVNTQVGGNMSPSWTSWNHSGYSMAANSQYRLEVDMGSSCNPSRAIINTSRSNIKNIANPTLLIKTPAQANMLVRTYPNPSNGVFSLEWNASLQVTKVDIIDLTGRIIQSFVPGPDQLKKTISLGNDAEGIYFVNFHSGKGIISKRIITTR